MTATDTLASAQRPGAETFSIETARSARDVEAMPLALGQNVYVGFKHMHALPTPISSLRLIATGNRAPQELGNTPLVQQLAERMHIEPLHYDDFNTSHEQVRGLPIVELGSDASVANALELLEQGARQVLVLVGGEPRVERMLIYVEPSSFGRDAVLSAVASLARHLPIDVGMLVRDEEDGSYRDLLDLRDVSLRVHGLDIRTETFRGSATEAVRERLMTSDEQTLLVIGLIRAGALQRPRRRSAALAEGATAGGRAVRQRSRQDRRRRPRRHTRRSLSERMPMTMMRNLLLASVVALGACGGSGGGEDGASSSS